MKLTGAIGLVIAASLAAPCLGYANDSAMSQYSNGDFHKLLREAHSAVQYRLLASFYRDKEDKLLAEAKSEKQEWIRLSVNGQGVAAKYPRPADSSRIRYEYLTYEAAKMDRQAEHFDDLANNAQ